MEREKLIIKIEALILSFEGWDLVQVNNTFASEARYYDEEYYYDFGDPEEFFQTFFGERITDAVRACVFGDINWNDEFIKFNGYGNLETTNYPEYFESTVVIAEYIFDNPSYFEGINSELDLLLEKI